DRVVPWLGIIGRDALRVVPLVLRWQAIYARAEIARQEGNRVAGIGQHQWRRAWLVGPVERHPVAVAVGRRRAKRSAGDRMVGPGIAVRPHEVVPPDLAPPEELLARVVIDPVPIGYGQSAR